MAITLETSNFFLLLAQAFSYFCVMAALFWARRRVGLGVFLCALGVMHFLETYLAAVFYIQLPFGIISPGSTVLFSGKLLMILLLYIKEDAATVRQPIYGLLIGNFLIVGLVVVLRNHEVVPAVPGREPNIAFVDEMGWLMVWGTALLFLDSIGVILLYEQLGRWLRSHQLARIFLASAAMLTFDQFGFFMALHYVTGAPWHVLYGGWAAKMGAALVFSLMVFAYLRLVERRTRDLLPAQLSDVFDTLTYRERYLDLLGESGRDRLTGALDRGRFDAMGQDLVGPTLATGEPVSLLAIDVDGLGRINDGEGRPAGDLILRDLARLLIGTMGDGRCHLFRHGGGTFAVVAQGLDHPTAVDLAELLRRTTARAEMSERGAIVTVSVGVATAPEDGRDLYRAYAVAESRLREAKAAGKDRVVGRDGVVLG
ncbi:MULTISPECIES: GGDEF domain-containing protein [Thalassobaculum]|uniref:diguanylate cyclase n=1 Tax=Thalassobaculum litoreum DSM 18839 TaxID=1123362 RepID=A0A8G2BDX6_9PROT|nr:MULTISPECIES: GGDEF domain-containing protein [Thalassobaculum]SDF09100.1 diguanylate cyclase (GGDEF) domain-containing protein [Thalassobaculum litoreum DSM 18839]